MKTTKYYSDARSSEFSVEKYEFFDVVGRSTIGESIFIRGHSGNVQLFFDSPEQIDEFCVSIKILKLLIKIIFDIFKSYVHLKL